VGARQRQLLTRRKVPKTNSASGARIYNKRSRRRLGIQPGFGGAGQGIVFGAEWHAQHGTLWRRLTFFSSQETEVHPRDTKSDGDWAWSRHTERGGRIISSSRRRSTPVWAICRAAAQSLSGTTSGWPWPNGNSYLAPAVHRRYILNLGQFQLIPTIAFDDSI